MGQVKQLIEISMENGANLYIETSGSQNLVGEDAFFVPVSTEKRIIKETRDYLEKVLGQIKCFSNSIANSVRNLDLEPDEFQIEFAIKFENELGAVISSISTESGIKVTLKWSNDNRRMG